MAIVSMALLLSSTLNSAWTFNPFTGQLDYFSTGTNATTINGASVPISASFVGTNSSGQIIAASISSSYNATFNVTSPLTLTIPEATHGFATTSLFVAFYDNASPANQLNVPYTVDPVTFQIVATFAAPQAGRVIVTSGGVGLQGPVGATGPQAVQPCEFGVGSVGTNSVTLATDNTELGICSNLTGATITISSVECKANVASFALNAATTGGSSILSGATCTCGNGTYSACTLSGTPTQANNGSLDFTPLTISGASQYFVRIKRQ